MNRTHLLRKALIATALVALVALTSMAEAAGPKYWTSKTAKSSRKLLRGFGNVAFGFIEIPLAIGVDVVETDPFTGTFTGLARGVGHTVERMGTGAFEIVTFPYDHMDDYQPLIEPEFVMMAGEREGLRDWGADRDATKVWVKEKLTFEPELEAEDLD